MTGPEVVLVIADALRADDRLHIAVQANEGLIVWAPDGSQYRVDVVEQP